ncbi:MAG: EF-hand domain-containing protein [Novosphingobium sp.]
MAGPLVALALALAGCGKETGPEEATPESVPAVAAPPASPSAGPSARRPLASFEAMDSDGNHMVSSVEHAKSAQTMFQVMDADRDGSVTVAEMDAARDVVGGTMTISSEKKIAAIDGDGDGQLTRAEHRAGANAVFALMDVNQDREADRAEWDKLHAMPQTSGRIPGLNRAG